MNEEERGPQVVLPDSQVQKAVDDIERQTPRATGSNPALSLAASLGFSLVGAALWAAITIATQVQLGLVAIVIGIVAGFGASLGGRGQAAQAIGATCAAVGYFAGEIAIAVYLVPDTAIATVVEPVVRDTFTSMGVLFLGIAVWEGWSIPRLR